MVNNIGKTKPTAMDGDVDGDGDVDSSDSAIVSSFEGESPAAYYNTDGKNMLLLVINTTTDFNGDGNSDVDDVVLTDEYVSTQNTNPCTLVTTTANKDDVCSEEAPNHPFIPVAFSHGRVYFDCTCGEAGSEVCLWPEGECDCAPVYGGSCGAWTLGPIVPGSGCDSSFIDGFSIDGCTYKVGSATSIIVCCYGGQNTFFWRTHPANGLGGWLGIIDWPFQVNSLISSGVRRGPTRQQTPCGHGILRTVLR